MDQSDDSVDGVKVFLDGRSNRLVGRLCRVYGICALVAAPFLTLPLWPIDPPVALIALAKEAIGSGFGGVIVATFFLMFTALLATLALTNSRRHVVTSGELALAAKTAPARLTQNWIQMSPGVAARQGQAVILSIGALLVWASCWLLWPLVSAAAPSPSGNVLAALAFALAFPMLVAQRVMNGFPLPQLPEAPSLSRLLLLTVVTTVLAGCIEIGRGIGADWLVWPARVLVLLLSLVAIEFALRALARLFLPASSPEEAKAATESLVVTVLTGGPRAPAVLIKAHFGLDFTRSWALRYVSSALIPALGSTALLCWILSGLKLVDLDQRGVYERLGAPVAVLKPGLHLLLPWPLGRLRPLEYGTIHEIAVGTDQQLESGALVSAEASPPASMNRLWDTAYPTEAEYLVASQSGGQQGFQAVSAEIHVLYRTGLADAEALQAVYGVADQTVLVKEEASRLVTRYFASRTIDAVLGASRESLAEALRAELARTIDNDKAGIEIVAILIEAMHPPSGAAAAYHGVQAAEIKADASISQETGRAERLLGVSQEEALQRTDAALASAEERKQGATADAYQFTADRKAYQQNPDAFLLERTNGDIAGALRQTALTLIDHRLSPGNRPTLDLRSLGAAFATGGPPATSAASPDNRCQSAGRRASRTSTR